MGPETLENEINWEVFVGRFVSGTLKAEEWTHQAHLAVAAWFISRYPAIEAGVRIRTGIRHLNECLGGVNSASRGYHETLTEFWILEVRSHLAEHGAGLESIRLLTQLPAGLWKKYYTIDLPKSRVARRQYIPHA